MLYMCCVLDMSVCWISSVVVEGDAGRESRPLEQRHTGNIDGAGACGGRAAAVVADMAPRCCSAVVPLPMSAR